MNEQRHEMVLELVHVSGMQGWYCPTCGRRLLFLVPPNNDMMVINPGDQYARHSGSTGGLFIGTIQVREQGEEMEEVSEESLRPWIEALKKINVDF